MHFPGRKALAWQPSYLVSKTFLGILFAFSLAEPAKAISYYNVSWDSPRFPEGSVNVQGYVSPGRQITADVGIFGLRFRNATEGPWDFMAVCADPRENLFPNGSPQLYAVEDLSSYTTIPNAPGASNSAISLSSQRKTLLSQLFFVAGRAAINGNSIASAAFQEAVWEIIGENLDSNPYNGDLNLGSGAVRITGSGDDIQVRNQANAYLAMLNPSVQTSMALKLWSPVREIRNSSGVVIGYERIAGQELLTPVPEPALYAVLVVGLAAAVWRTKRRRGSMQLAAATPESCCC